MAWTHEGKVKTVKLSTHPRHCARESNRNPTNTCYLIPHLLAGVPENPKVNVTCLLNKNNHSSWFLMGNCSFGSGFYRKNWSSQQTWQPYILFFFLLWISCSSSSEKLSQEVSNVVSRDLKGRSLKMITVLLTKDLWQASAGDLIYTK